MLYVSTAHVNKIAISLLIVQTIALPGAFATNQVQGSITKTTAHPSATKQFFQKHDKVRQAAIGAGVGTAAGALTGLITHKGVVRGAAIGAGAGAGVGLINSSQTLKKHPIMRDMATGTVAGLGLGLAGSRHGRKIAQVGAVGAAVGLGAGLLRDRLR